MVAELNPDVKADRTAKNVAIIGAGYAGLACAVELARRGVAVTVFERSMMLGGRARGVYKDGREFENGQHLLIGAYSELARLLRLTGCSPKKLLRLPLTLHVPGQLLLRAAPLPAPFHLAFALLRAKGLSWADRFAMLRLMRWLKKRAFRLPAGMTVEGLLGETAQTDRLNTLVWRPLCIAALNTPTAEACAQVFANVLRDSLAAHAEASEFLIPRVNLSELFPVPATRFLATRRGRVYTGCAIRAIHSEADGFYLEGDDRRQLWDHVVIATAPYHAAPLLKTVPGGEGLAERIQVMAHEPILSLYLDYGEDRILPSPVVGLTNGPVHWAFDRGVITGNAADQGVIACTISTYATEGGEGAHEALLASVHAQIEQVAGRTLPPPRWSQIITEKRATFACRPGIFRPAVQTPVPGLWLAGDYVASDYPATLEAAVRAGVASAEAILSDSRAGEPAS